MHGKTYTQTDTGKIEGKKKNEHKKDHFEPDIIHLARKAQDILKWKTMNNPPFPLTI